ncbi:hypothetical protein PSYMO_14882, partial [Pseudomonas amygdali pv. mori str. 301020]
MLEIMLIQDSTGQDEDVGYFLYQRVQRWVLFGAVQHVQVNIGVVMGEKVQRGAQAGLEDMRVVMNGYAAADPIFFSCSSVAMMFPRVWLMTLPSGVR